MKDLEIGQVLAFKIRYNNSGTIAVKPHPYLVVGIDMELNTVEIAQLDSLAGKEYKAAKRSNKVIYCDNPQETVIDKDSYIQKDNTITVEYHENLSKYRRQKDKLSEGKLKDVLNSYRLYHEKYRIDENKQVYMSWEELQNIQKGKPYT